MSNDARSRLFEYITCHCITYNAPCKRLAQPANLGNFIVCSLLLTRRKACSNVEPIESLKTE